MTDRGLEKRIFLLLGAYFLLQLIVRLLVSPGLELDEAEQLLLTQQIILGYGSQPPLYTWLLSALFKLFGTAIFPLALLKNLLLFGTYFFVYRTARLQGYGVPAAMAAMLSLFFIPQIVWESQRDLTHSVLVTTMTAATIYCWARLKQSPTRANYLLIGICWGIGLLGKYNFGIFVVSLLAASLTIAEYRALVLNSRIMISVATMLAMIAPHAIWAVTHQKLLLASSGKFKQAAQGSYLHSVFQGMGSLVSASLAFSAPLLIIYLVIWYRNRTGRSSSVSAGETGHPAPNLLLRCIVAGQAICLVMILIFQVTAFKDRWMQPLLFFLPLALLPVMNQVFSQQRGKLPRVAAGAAAVAVIVLLGLSLRAVAAPYTGSITRFNMPYYEAVTALEAQLKPVDSVLVQNGLLGGAIRLHNPKIRVVIPDGARLFHDATPASMLVVWQNGSTWRQDEKLSHLVTAMMGDTIRETPYPPVQTPFRYLPLKTLSVSSALIERTVPGAE